MGTTPIYGFPYPDPSDLVANYPALGQQLAEDVETEIAGIPKDFAHLGTFTVSAGTSIVANSVFTSTYSVYKMSGVFTTTNNDINIALRLRVSGTDATGSDYRFNNIAAQASPSSGSGVQTSFNPAGLDNDYPNVYDVTLINPQLASVTGYIHNHYTGYATGQQSRSTGIHNVSTAYDGFTLFSPSTFSGTLYLYGMVAS